MARRRATPSLCVSFRLPCTDRRFITAMTRRSTRSTSRGRTSVGFREWVLQDWQVNAERPECQLLLAWFRLAQWAADHWGALGRLIVTPYWLIMSLVVGVELPPDVKIGPRLRLYHPHGIVVSPRCE